MQIGKLYHQRYSPHFNAVDEVGGDWELKEVNEDTQQALFVRVGTNIATVVELDELTDYFTPVVYGDSK